MNQYTASVKVMRSHDYCHFEVQLGSTEPVTLNDVDAMRKEAARLADKAVEQYKVAKEIASEAAERKYQLASIQARATQISSKADTDQTTKEKAFLKAWQDYCHSSRVSSRRYDYEDDWQDFDDEEFESIRRQAFDDTPY